MFDPHFVEKVRYAELLVSEIPPKQRFEVMIDVFNKKQAGDGGKLRFFVATLLPTLSDEERQETFRIVSEELKRTTNQQAIISTFYIFPPDFLKLCDETARLRIENKMIQSVIEGVFVSPKSGPFDGREGCLKGQLGTWAGPRCQYFLLKDDLLSALMGKLESTDYEVEYVCQYFFDELPVLCEQPSRRLRAAIRSLLKSGNRSVFRSLRHLQVSNAEWVTPFADHLKSFEAEHGGMQAGITDDDIPF